MRASSREHICTLFRNRIKALQVYMDSEGIAASGQADSYSARLFIMCTMFSSLFVYNHRGILEARVFQELSIVAAILEDYRPGDEISAHEPSL
jgi:alkylated DNA repair dioxygenase AlkB